MTDLIFKINANNCEVDLPTITFFDEATDDSIIITLDIEKVGGVITQANIKKAEYWFEQDWTKEQIEVTSDMQDEVIQAIQDYDSNAFCEFDGYRNDHERCGIFQSDFA